jgi:DNA helicase-2/ATP-dependent DNA helicase PcrA
MTEVKEDHFLLQGLNKSQQDAVRFIDAPQLILAGAGSGKTKVLTRKLAWLIECGNYSPWNILAMTFTNKAAKEMKNRVAGLLKMPLKGMWVNTFHSICLRLLRTYIDETDIDPDFVIFDEDDRKKVIKKILKSFDNQILKKEFNLFTLPGPGFISEEISRAKDNLILPEELIQTVSGDKERLAARVYAEYQKNLKDMNALDFDDIIMKTVLMLKNNESLRIKLQGKFAYILVDEFQDTNTAQFELVKLLGQGHKKVCAVGDEDQSIYRWRGAEPENMKLFMSCFSEDNINEHNIFKLQENYRSVKEILEIANDIISHNYSRTSNKKLISMCGSGSRPVYYTAVTEKDEAAFIAGNIEWLCREEDFSFSDFAIFYRTHSQSRVLEDFLRKAGIPYRLVRGTAFYSRAEIKDIFAYLKLICNPKDNIALTRIINVPPRKIGKVSLEKIEAAASFKGVSMAEWIMNKDYSGLFKGQAAGNLTKFADFLINQIDNVHLTDITDFFDQFIDELGYLEYLREKGDSQDRDRAENIEELKTSIRDFAESMDDFDENLHENDLAAFLEYVSLVSDVDLLDESADMLVEKGYVSLMTLHCAKGLEYRAVFMAGMEENLLPHYNSLETDYEIEDERRLCYVGITRAKERLFLTSAARRLLYGKSQFNMPSRFLHEINSENLDMLRSKSLSYFRKN